MYPLISNHQNIYLFWIHSSRVDYEHCKALRSLVTSYNIARMKDLGTLTLKTMISYLLGGLLDFNDISRCACFRY